MRWYNDEKLARKVDGIDIVLGGHDHDYKIKKVNKLEYILNFFFVCFFLFQLIK